MESKNPLNKRIHRLFKLAENRQNFKLFYKFLSQPSRGLSLCQGMPEEREKILSVFKSDPLINRIHFIDMVNPLCGTMELQQIINDAYERSGAQKNIFFIYNIEDCIVLLKTDDRDFFQEMNLIRDFFMQFNAVFVFFVKESSVKQMIQNAFDFYDWMKFTFTFVPEREDLSLQPIAAGEYDKIKYSNPREKIEYLKSSIKKVKDEKDKSLRLMELGALYRQIGNYEDALKQFLESLKIEERYGDLARMGKGYHVISQVYSWKDDPDKALEFAFKASEIFEKKNNLPDLAALYNNIARLYQDKRKPDKALEFVLKALDIFKKIDNRENLEIVNSNIDKIYKSRGVMTVKKQKGKNSKRTYTLEEVLKENGIDYNTI